MPYVGDFGARGFSSLSSNALTCVGAPNIIVGDLSLTSDGVFKELNWVVCRDLEPFTG